MATYVVCCYIIKASLVTIRGVPYHRHFPPLSVGTYVYNIAIITMTCYGSQQRLFRYYSSSGGDMLWSTYQLHVRLEQRSVTGRVRSAPTISQVSFLYYFHAYIPI